MKLTQFSDYSLRVLIALGALPKERKVNIEELSISFHISKNHLMKVVHQLGKLELITTVRGRNGGIYLSKAPKDINIGWVIRHTEDHFHLVECFNRENNQCFITPVCGYQAILNEAVNQFLATLDKYTLEDVLGDRQLLQNMIVSSLHG
ncbi:Rrf2 family transcriptional regulator [Terrilactibacillus sp. BCM23-1]|uniref:HTH-type transcriptional regulator NsrR n=1 Tax=Terrilactibacillus tamarindi TaxID=2599694 RepID=A0A6N8CQG9_9BACI|nr:Rrf2 family transcriptional regulator [Terrilactibacillus tamarindi]MTT31908.1 Rrf2 family transcriptional regulator [Terrilactibacillus tamarindi]